MRMFKPRLTSVYFSCACSLPRESRALLGTGRWLSLFIYIYIPMHIYTVYIYPFYNLIVTNPPENMPKAIFGYKVVKNEHEVFVYFMLFLLPAKWLFLCVGGWLGREKKIFAFLWYVHWDRYNWFSLVIKATTCSFWLIFHLLPVVFCLV